MNEQKMREELQIRREQFEKDIKRFYDAGFLTVLESNEYYTICNLTNCCYVFFPYGKSRKYDGQVGLLFDKDVLKSYMRDNIGFVEQVALERMNQKER